MTNDQKKMLTEWLGECWHEVASQYMTQGNGWLCKHCRKTFTVNRTFTTWQDVGDYKNMLVADGLWAEFILYVAKKYNDLNKGREIDLSGSYVVIEFTSWLFRSVDESGNPHFCRLVAGFLEKRKGEKEDEMSYGYDVFGNVVPSIESKYSRKKGERAEMITTRKKQRTYQEVLSCICDRCGKEFLVDDVIEMQEFHHIRFTGGYGSVFGDEIKIECDLCQCCLKELIEPYYREGGGDAL